MPELDADAIGAVLGAIVDEDHWVTRRTAAAWCAVSKAHRDACYETETAWRALTTRHFPHARTLVRGCARANYNALYNLVRAYGTGEVRMQDAPTADKNTKAFVVAAVRHDGNALADVLDWAQADRDVVFAASNSGNYVLHRRDLMVRFGDDREIVLGIVSRCGFALELVSKRLRNDREVVIAAVRQCGYAHMFASPAMFSDEAVLAAVRTDKRGVDKPWY